MSIAKDTAWLARQVIPCPSHKSPICITVIVKPDTP